MGLIGQITSQILNANGCKVIGTDVDERIINNLKKQNYEVYKSDENLEKVLNETTNGNGVDGVIICAGTTSNSLID